MKMLVTSGGTSVMIDGIRCITNLSHGRFGKEIAVEFMSQIFDGAIWDISSRVMLWRSEGAAKANIPLLDQLTYFTFDEYLNGLRSLCLNEKPDIVVLSAAVSDYGVDKQEGKIDSSGELTLKLKPLPKVISMVREWCGEKTVICGFKLLVGASKEELVSRARKQIKDNNIDLVVANDWSTIKDADHKIHIVTMDDVSTYNREFYNHASAVVDECILRYNTLKNNGWRR